MNLTWDRYRTLALAVSSDRSAMQEIGSEGALTSLRRGFALRRLALSTDWVALLAAIRAMIPAARSPRGTASFSGIGHSSPATISKASVSVIAWR